MSTRQRSTVEYSCALWHAVPKYSCALRHALPKYIPMVEEYGAQPPIELLRLFQARLAAPLPPTGVFLIIIVIVK